MAVFRTSHPGVTCPTCDSWKSPKKLFHTAQAARYALNRKCSTVCNECQAEFTYIAVTKSRKHFGWFGKILQTVTVQDMVVVKEGKL